MIPRFLPSSSGRFTRLLAVLALLIAPSLSRADPCDCPGGKKAYVLVGDVRDPKGFPFLPNVAANTAGEASIDYQKIGLTVITKNPATKQDVLNAVADPCIRALWIFGHGSYTSKGKGGEPEPFISMADDFLGANEVPINNCIKSVTLQACGQDLQEWRARFPAAVSADRFYAWSVEAWCPLIYWWQWGHTECALPPERPTVTLAAYPDLQARMPLSCTDGPPIAHSSVQPDSHQTYFYDERGVFVFDISSPPQNRKACTELAAPLGEKTFNLSIQDASELLFMFHARIRNGGIYDLSTVQRAADYDVVIASDAFGSLVVDPYALPLAEQTGSLIATANNAAAASVEKEFRSAFGWALFGVQAGECQVGCGSSQRRVVTVDRRQGEAAGSLATSKNAFSVYPNPTRAGEDVALAASASANVEISVVTAAGRIIADLGRHRFGPGTRRVLWHGHDPGGRRITPGVYYLRVTSLDDGVCHSLRLVLLN